MQNCLDDKIYTSLTFYIKKSYKMKKELKKYLEGWKLLKKEETKLWKFLRTKADTVFSIWIRNRDKGKWCITKQAQGCKNLIQHNCHWIDRGWYSHRWDEENCYGWCASCNTFHEWEHKIHLTNYLIKRFWQDRVDENLKKRHKKKPSIKDLLQIIEKYKL